MMNIVPPVSAEQMARLAVEDGVSVFILGSDDPQEIRRFATVTAAEIRDRVGAARAEARTSAVTL
jgi:3-dehydroquinate synthase class II